MKLVVIDLWLEARLAASSIPLFVPLARCYMGIYSTGSSQQEEGGEWRVANYAPKMPVPHVYTI